MPLRLSIHPLAKPGTIREFAPQIIDVEVTEPGAFFGRRSGVEVELPFPAVSGRHARLYEQGGNFWLEDLQSTNGTWLGDKRLLPHAPALVGFGETFRISNIEIRIEGASGMETIEVPSLRGNDTLARRLVADLFSVCPPAEPTALVVEAGPDEGKSLPLLAVGRTYLVGRGPSCDWQLSDDEMSREHAEFLRTSDGVRAHDRGSKNGIFVNHKPMVGYYFLHDGDRIRLGNTRLRLQDPEDRYLREMQAKEAEENVPHAILVEATLPEEIIAEPERGPEKATGALALEAVEEVDLPRKNPAPKPSERSWLPLLAMSVAGVIFLSLVTIFALLTFGFWK